MNHWLCITTIDNWDVTLKKNILGFREKKRNEISSVMIGDMGFIYIKVKYPKVKNSYITAKFGIISKIYKEETSIFNSPQKTLIETYPLRFKIKILQVSEIPIDFKELVPKLSFIRDKRTWGMRLRGHALIRLPDQDAEIIESKFK